MYVNVSMICAPNTNIMEYENKLSPSSFQDHLLEIKLF